MFPIGIINVCCGMIPCGKRLMGGMLSGGFATLNRPAKFGFFLTEKLGDAGRAPFQAPLRLRGGAWVVWRAAFQQPLRLRGEGLNRGSCQIPVFGGVA